MSIASNWGGGGGRGGGVKDFIFGVGICIYQFRECYAFT